MDSREWIIDTWNQSIHPGLLRTSYQDAAAWVQQIVHIPSDQYQASYQTPDNKINIITDNYQTSIKTINLL